MNDRQSNGPGTTGKVIAVHGRLQKIYGQGIIYTSILRGKILKDQLSSSPIVVGDNVEFLIGPDGQATIEKILPRRQFLARPDLLVKGQTQIIAANLDQLVVVSSTRAPRFKPGLIDRFIVNAEYENLQPAIVINKTDLADSSGFTDYAKVWRKLGYPVVFTSAKTGEGLPGLLDVLKEKSSVFAGHSGVGKSSLLNALDSRLQLKTREISEATGRGVHTTTSVIMYPLACGGWVTDTPGLKVFGLTGFKREYIPDCFLEMRKLKASCRFSDCIHISEPGCLVKAAVESGEIARFRYESYLKIISELN